MLRIYVLHAFLLVALLSSTLTIYFAYISTHGSETPRTYTARYEVLDAHGVSRGTIEAWLSVGEEIHPGDKANVSLIYYGGVGDLLVEIKLYLVSGGEKYLLGRAETLLHTGRKVVERIPLYIEVCMKKISGALSMELDVEDNEYILVPRWRSREINTTYVCP